MKIKKRTIKITVLVLLVVLVAAWMLNQRIMSESWKISYPNRPVPNFKINLINDSGDIQIFAVEYDTKPFLNHPAKLHALLFKPKKKVPGLVLIPGGGVDKEGEFPLALQISRWGYAVLTFDTRGVGQTGGYYLSFEDDKKVFDGGNEPVQHLLVYDALVSFDVLSEIDGVENVAIAGESMGGRAAIIAASVEPEIKGLVIISSSGYHASKDADKYFRSIDPDQYIKSIQRPLFFLHGSNDSVIPLEDAQYTHSLVEQTPFFVAYDMCILISCQK